MVWLLEFDTREKMENAETKRGQFAREQQEFEATVAAYNSDDMPRIMTVAGNTAEIAVTGVLTPAPDFFARFFGGGNTTYSEINAALLRADADPNVQRVDLRIDSPGGTISGLFDVLATLQNMKKPTRALVGNMAASAAYALASQADTVVALNRAARFGSIGVVVSYYKPSGIYDITSTKAPKKRPDPSTKEGQETIREELDALHQLFVEAIASGRGKTVAQINDGFGEGALVVAEDALKRGMIDTVEGGSLRAVSASAKEATADHGGEKGKGNMDLETLRATHPDVYKAAVDAGVSKERDRVNAHLTAGEMSGDMATAVKAAREGTEMTSSLQMQYLMTAANKGDQQRREEDDAAAASASNVSANQGQDSANTSEQEVLALVQAKLGLAGE